MDFEMRATIAAAFCATLLIESAAAATAVYRCGLNVDIFAEYSVDAKSVTVFVQGQTYHLPVAMSGSGSRYSDGTTTLWEHQGQASFETRNASFTACKVVATR